jgi:hypothetical protein
MLGIDLSVQTVPIMDESLQKASGPSMHRKYDYPLASPFGLNRIGPQASVAMHSTPRHQKVLADSPPQFIHPIEKLR